MRAADPEGGRRPPPIRDSRGAVLPVLANSLIYASEIAIIAVGVALVYSILRFANFAHIQYAVLGGYLSYSATLAGLAIVPAVAVSAVATGIVAVVIDRLVFRPLRHIAPEGKMIVSWGVALVLRSLIAAVFGGSALVFDIEVAPVRIGDVVVTTLDIAVVATTVAAMAALHVALRYTRLGTALRALASNPELAETRGIPAERMTALMWFVSGAFAAIGGTLFALETRLQPSMDLVILLPVFAAVTIGGLGSPGGAVLGALLLSLVQNFAIAIDFGSLFGGASWYLPTQFRDAVAVAALVAALVLRPRARVGAAR